MLVSAGLSLMLLQRQGQAVAQGVAPLERLQLGRGDEGLQLAYAARLELPRTIDDALHKGVPLYFVARAELLRKRWYWRDAVVARAQRQWRLSFQPLSRQYRLSTGGLHRNHDSLAEALATIGRNSNWPLELREELDAGSRYELLFSLKLDTTQLPGPLQIGLGPGNVLALERTLPLLPADLMAAPASP